METEVVHKDEKVVSPPVRSKNFLEKKAPPFPTEKHWLFGSGYLMKDRTFEVVKFFIDKYGDILSLSLPLNRLVVISTPEFAKYVLLDNAKNYRKSLAYDILKFVLGNGLVTSEGDFWRQQRRLIQPAFHRRKLESITSLMVKCAEHTAEKFEKLAKEGTTFDVSPEMTDLTLDVISRATFSSGVEEKAAIVGKQITLLNEYAIEKLNQPIRLPAFVPTPFNVKERRALKILDEVIYDIIDTRRKEGVSKDDLLSMLIDAKDEDTGESMDNRQLRDEVMTIFIAGNETSSNALSWTLYLISKHPEVEKKLMAEIDSKMAAGTTLTFASVMEFHYTRMVIEESMRLYPPVWMLGRRNLTDDEIGGYYIQKNTNVLMPIIYFHHNEKYWPEPEKFDPERFAPEKRGQIDRYVYFPFGGGPRICIGNNFAMLEMQIILITFYSRFRFRLKEGFEPEPDPLVTLRSKNGMWMKVEKREKSATN